MEIRMNKNAVLVTNMKNSTADNLFLKNQFWEYRLTALELLRQQLYNYSDETTTRLQRVYRITQRK